MPERILNNRFGFVGHIVFWILSVCFWLFLFFYNSANLEFNIQLLTKSVVVNFGFALAVYLNLYLLIPKLLKRKKYIFYVFWLILTLTFSSVIIQFLLIFPLRKILHFNEQNFSSDLHAAYFFATFIYIGISSLLKFIKDWLSIQDLNLKIARIEQQKLEAELKTLKSQLNPHFLFNSLNNIYSLALSQSPKVPELILKLSDLMRHIIYESKENYIALEKEIDFATNFIALQKIRIPDNNRILYETKGSVPLAKIAPLIFEPFIDNAFKYGFPNADKNDFIRIVFDFSTSGYLYFEIQNNYSPIDNNSGKNSGIGINNVKQRLKHLYKSKEYQLTINTENNIFTVSLRLKLK